jgi:hypothetical protein
LSGVAEADALDAAAEDAGFAVQFGWHIAGLGDLTKCNIRKWRGKGQVYFYW